MFKMFTTLQRVLNYHYSTNHLFTLFTETIHHLRKVGVEPWEWEEHQCTTRQRHTIHISTDSQMTHTKMNSVSITLLQLSPNSFRHCLRRVDVEYV